MSKARDLADGTAYAHPNGDATKEFKVADAVDLDDAVNKEQLDISIAASGKILNVWEYASSTELVVNTSTFTDTEYTLTVTPKTANSRFLVMYNVNVRFRKAKGLGCRFTSNGTAIEAGHSYETYAGGLVDNDPRFMSSKTRLHAPNTTGDVTYTLQMASYGSSAQINEQNNKVSNIIIFELGE